MKNIMILAGGTATAWHIAGVLKQYYENEVNITICDINPTYLVHTSIFADFFQTIPSVDSEGYFAFMLGLMEKRDIDILVPLIDKDILSFPADSVELQNLKIRSTAPKKDTSITLSNKINMENFLKSINISTPEIITSDFDTEKEYFTKDIVGFGSRNAFSSYGGDLSENDETKLIQELCFKPEITVDAVFLDNTLHTICRERIETKLGVSTKCRLFFDPFIHATLEKVSQNISLPTIFCVQFMKNKEGEWSLTDFNLRSGGGTAISAAIGFEAVRTASATWLGLSPSTTWLKLPEGEKYVARAYTEVVTL